MLTAYSPVAYEHREVIEEAILKRKAGKIFFFDDKNRVNSLEGRVVQLLEQNGHGLFIMTEPEGHVRIDRIITLFGIPGAAYDEYDSFGRSCLDCTGGYPL